MPPAKTLREAYNLANPTEPLPPDDERYVNCTDVRGDEDTVSQMFKTISYSDIHTHRSSRDIAAAANRRSCYA